MSPYNQYPVQPTSPSADLAMEMGTDPTKVQVMRASFFGMIDDDVDEFESKSGTYSMQLKSNFRTKANCINHSSFYFKVIMKTMEIVTALTKLYQINVYSRFHLRIHCSPKRCPARQVLARSIHQS